MLYRWIGDGWKVVYRCRQCPECHVLFAIQGKRVFCSYRCQRRALWARFTQRHPDRQRDYAKEYADRRARQAA